LFLLYEFITDGKLYHLFNAARQLKNH